MILIADAGGTKTDWRLIDGDQVSQFQSAGLSLSLKEQFVENLPAEIPRQINQLNFYGAGLAEPQDQEHLKDLLAQSFSADRIAVYPDTLGAARAVHGHAAGWLGILGTGSAAVYYDGQEITQLVP